MTLSMRGARHTRCLAAAVAVCYGANGSALAQDSHDVRATPAVTRGEQLRDMNALYLSPWTVNPGHVQLESYAIQYAHDKDDAGRGTTTREAWVFGPVTLKVGVLTNCDLEITATPFTRVRTKAEVPRRTTVQRGFGDVYTGVKYNVVGNDGGSFALAVLPFVKFPTSDDDLGNEHWEGGVVIPLGIELPSGWWLMLSPEVDVSHDLFSAGYHADFANTTYLCHRIADRLSGYIDFYSWVSTERHTRMIGIVDFGLTLAATSNVQVDAGLSVAVTKWGDDVNPYVGLSVRY